MALKFSCTYFAVIKLTKRWSGSRQYVQYFFDNIKDNGNILQNIKVRLAI